MELRAEYYVVLLKQQDGDTKLTKYWDRSIKIIEDDGGVAIIRNVEEAADYMIWMWPRPRPCNTFEPIGTVFKAISDDKYVFDARLAFVSAAQEVGLTIE